MKKNTIKTNKKPLLSRTEKIKQRLDSKRMTKNIDNTFINGLPSFNSVKDTFTVIS